MKKPENNLEALSLEELHKKAKTTKTFASILAGLVIVQFATGIFLTTQQGFNVFIMVPFAFLPLVLINFSNIKKINEEIARRNS